MEAITTEKNAWIITSSAEDISSAVSELAMGGELDTVVFKDCIEKVNKDSSLLFVRNLPPFDLMLSIVESHEATLACGTHKKQESRIHQHCIIVSPVSPAHYSQVCVNGASVEELVMKNWTVIENGKVLTPMDCARRGVKRPLPKDEPLKSQGSVFTKPKEVVKVSSVKNDADEEAKIGTGHLQAFEKAEIPSSSRAQTERWKEMMPIYLNHPIESLENYRERVLSICNFFFQKALKAIIMSRNPQENEEPDWHKLGVRNRFMYMVGCGKMQIPITKFNMTRQMMVLAMFDARMNLRPRPIYDAIIQDMKDNNQTYLVKDPGSSFYSHTKAQEAVQEFINMTYGFCV
ncbi:hypothetical protein AbHV_ORF101 [Abalone herpesvirus Victoria/AUS/2009]|uniref:Uncharacterized protein n=3 Tax=Herpesvirales TaxID=548681 RepID=K4JYL5_ABHV|nr:hypothetical protein AbHV_ORF101 [Abalone herpesvirus Victoria/AUS/2009]ADP36936.1 p133c [Abalone herpesvirus Victoria/AUS/2007]AFU90113.1 hypothetical protein AbHV_ORF101 [Abalone herpesvirus Victoria/AUS/2009]AMW36262.1 hypothetical protein tc2005_p118 [Abalone herpesvirus Taiwan/2005]UCX57088.1 ORF97 [Haliotid herpesvirus 1]